MELAHGAALLRPLGLPAEPHGAHQEVGADLPRLEQRHRVQPELLGGGHPTLALAPVALALVLAALLLVARHHDDLHLPLHHHPPPVVDGVRQRALARDVRIAAARPLDVVGVDVVAAGDPGELGQHHAAVVEGEDVLVPVLLPVRLAVPLGAGELIFVLEFFAVCFQSLKLKHMNQSDMIRW